MYREALTACEAKTGMERSHHLAASLYFGIAALEAFLNRKMRENLHGRNTEEEVVGILRKGRLLDKIAKWPEELLGKRLILDDATLSLIDDFNDIRGDLTHPKTFGHDIYARLENIEPREVVDVVAEYIVKFQEAGELQYPYWIFGWNYLNPRPNSYEIILVNNQQFCFSMRALGVQLPSSGYISESAGTHTYLGTFEGYTAINNILVRLEYCEPKWSRFPFKPILCRRWWIEEHHHSCGHVTEEAMGAARDY